MGFCHDLKRHVGAQAAEGEAGMLQAAMRARGCKEDFVPNPELLQEGKVRPWCPRPTLIQFSLNAAPHICIAWPCQCAPESPVCTLHSCRVLRRRRSPWPASELAAQGMWLHGL